uniref:Uncharacterized protein n=1 Tax=Tetranychus urticae TaxID=32264 RepID=T1JPY9_TETUR
MAKEEPAKVFSIEPISANVVSSDPFAFCLLSIFFFRLIQVILDE